MDKENNRKQQGLRFRYAAAFLAIFAVEAFIALYVHDRFIRPYIGDVLVVVLINCFVRIIVPAGLPRLPLWVFLFAAFVEAMQYFGLAGLLGLQDSRAARIILGSVFDLKDIASYGVGCLMLQLYERHKRRI